MDVVASVGTVFNNASVSAFLGAFAAFGLVVLNDRRREQRKVRLIAAEIQMNLEHAKDKLETVRRNRTAMREHNKIVPAPILRFNTGLIRSTTTEVADLLTLHQRRAIEGICYTMEALDEILQGAYERTQHISNALGQADRVHTAERLLGDYTDAIANLKRLAEMCEHYIGKRYETIVTKQYDRLDYEEP